MVFTAKWKNSSLTKTYQSWRHMKSRCNNPSNLDYPNYGGRGITVCDRWLNDYDAFFEDMGERPKGFSLDRINNNGNYEPLNCRWATPTEQANNKRNNSILTINGKTQTLSQWAKEKNIHHTVLLYRINARLPPEQLFSHKKIKPKNYLHLKNLPRKDNVIIEFDNQKLTIAQWAEKTGLRPDTIWHRIYSAHWAIEKSLTVPASTWNHGTNTGYSKYKCRCKECTEYNRIKSKKARDKLKLKQGV